MILRWFGYACLAIICSAIIATAGIIAWFIADRDLPVQVLSSEVLTPLVKPGGKLIIRTRVRYVRECKGHVDRILFDAHTHRAWLPDIDYERPAQGLGEFTYTAEIDVPDYFEPGDGEYRAVPIYYCNPLQRYYWPITRDDVVVRFQIAAPR